MSGTKSAPSQALHLAYNEIRVCSETDVREEVCPEPGPPPRIQRDPCVLWHWCPGRSLPRARPSTSHTTRSVCLVTLMSGTKSAPSQALHLAYNEIRAFCDTDVCVTPFLWMLDYHHGRRDRSISLEYCRYWGWCQLLLDHWRRAIRIRFMLPNDIVTEDVKFHLPANKSTLKKDARWFSLKKDARWFSLKKDALWFSLKKDARWFSLKKDARWFSLKKDARWFSLKKDARWFSLKKDARWFSLKKDARWFSLKKDARWFSLKKDARWFSLKKDARWFSLKKDARWFSLKKDARWFSLKKDARWFSLKKDALWFSLKKDARWFSLKKDARWFSLKKDARWFSLKKDARWFSLKKDARWFSLKKDARWFSLKKDARWFSLKKDARWFSLKKDARWFSLKKDARWFSLKKDARWFSLKKDARWFSQQTAPERIRRQIMEKSSGKFHRLCVGISWRRTGTSLKWSSYWTTNGVATFRRVTVWKPSMISREKESANTINAESQRIAMIWLASVFVPDRLCVPVVVASLRRNTSTVIAKIAYYLRVQ